MNPAVVRVLKLHFPTILWAALIGWSMTLSSDTVRGLAPISALGLDKVAHAFLFFVFALLFARSLTAMSVRAAILAAFLAAGFYGALTEFIQARLLDRSGDWADLAADAAGAGAAALVLIRRTRRRDRGPR